MVILLTLVRTAVSTVASVSGGSITNGYVAQECDFGTVDVAEFDSVARRLIGNIIRRGLVSPKQGIGFVFVVVVLAIIVAALAAWFSGQPLVSAGLVVVVGLVVQSRGRIIPSGVIKMF